MSDEEFKEYFSDDDNKINPPKKRKSKSSDKQIKNKQSKHDIIK